MVDSSFLSAFVYSIEKAVSSMLGTPCRPSLEPRAYEGNYVSGVVYLTGREHGRLALSFPKRTALRVVAEMLGVDPQEVSDRLLRDGVAEMTNIVAGNAKALLADTPYAFSMSLPKVVLGKSMLPGTSTADQATNRCFDTSLGPLSMALWMTGTHPQSTDRHN